MPTDFDSPGKRAKVHSPGRVLIVTSVMFTFISFWRAAAIVLCDLASTAFYIGGIVESAIGKAAPWFILAVMLFSYAVRNVYIESCSMFVRGGVYRVVKEAMGGTLAKLAASALIFDFILTGPISSVSAGQYLLGLFNEFLDHNHIPFAFDRSWGSIVIAILITLYFYRANLIGIHESSDKALKIMGATTFIALLMIAWCGITLALRPECRSLPPLAPDLSRKIDAQSGEPLINPILHKQEDPLGFLGDTRIADHIRDPKRVNWWSLLGLFGIAIAFGHSILAMSGEETLAQVYREVESPKLRNFQRAAFIVFAYSLLLTSLISFFAVMIIPDAQRLALYKDNLIGGLAMHVVGPIWARLALHGLVVFVGFLILSGAVNTAIVGSNGVLNRVSEDGVIPDWFLKPHPRYGTTYRLLNLIVILQIVTIMASRGDVIILGEAYAFGVVWSFVFMVLAMLVLRFKQPDRPREFEMPLNIPLGRYHLPLGLAFVLLVLVISAFTNLLTKPVATLSGIVFTAGFFTAFLASEKAHRKRLGLHGEHEHLEQFNEDLADRVGVDTLELTHPYRKLVAIRSPYNLAMLAKSLEETDPETTDVVVMTCTVLPPGIADYKPTLTKDERALMTAVVNLAEQAGKPVKPLVLATNEPLYAMAKTAKTIGARELVMGASNKYSPDDQLDQIALYWLDVCKGEAEPLTVRVLSKERDVSLDIAGGGRIPRIGERSAASAVTLAELRASWHGVESILLAYDGSALSMDFLDTVLSFLDPDVSIILVNVAEPEMIQTASINGVSQAEKIALEGVMRAQELGRQIRHRTAQGEAGEQIVRIAVAEKVDAIFMSLRGEYRRGDTTAFASNTRYVLEHAPCRVILGFAPKTINAADAAD